MTTLIGQGKMEKLCFFAQMVPAREGLLPLFVLRSGLKIGLVDQVVTGKSEVLKTAVETMKKLLKLPDSGRWLVKSSVRSTLADELASDERLQEEAEGAWGFLSMPQTVKALDGVLARLSKSKL